jgi:solute carrier family 66, member 2
MLIVDIAIAIGPIFGYIAQLKLLKQTKALGSFSIDVCAILIFSNILRMYFWFTTGYAFNLFIQSILVIIIQLILLQ